MIFNSLKTKLTFLITLVITLISLFVFLYFPQKFQETQLKAIKNKANTIAQIATISVGSALFFNDMDALEEEISSLPKIDNVEYIVIKSLNGSIVYEFNLSQALEKKYSNINDGALSPDQNTFMVRKSIEFNDEAIGVLFMGYSLKELKMETSSIKDNIGIVSLAILIIGITLVIIIGGYMTKPLTMMVETVKKIGDGDLSQRAQVISNDELGLLADSFNKMTEAISKSQETLENKVLERTDQLARTNAKLTDEIEERKKTEIELNKAKEDAERSDRLKSEFLAQMSHEIRAPINIISNFMQIYESELNDKLSPELKNSISSVKSQSLRIITTIDSIINMAQLKTGTFIPKLQIIKFYPDIIKPSLKQWQAFAKDKNIDLNICGEFENILVEGDVYSLNQVINHIVDNAIKYTDKGEVEVKCSCENDFVIINVSDTGNGISEEYLPHIFEPFSQEYQGYGRKYEGNGLGMALVKQYSLLNNASIKIDSKKGVGTVVRLTLPLLKPGTK